MVIIKNADIFFLRSVKGIRTNILAKTEIGDCLFIKSPSPPQVKEEGIKRKILYRGLGISIFCCEDRMYSIR